MYTSTALFDVITIPWYHLSTFFLFFIFFVKVALISSLAYFFLSAPEDPELHHPCTLPFISFQYYHFFPFDVTGQNVWKHPYSFAFPVLRSCQRPLAQFQKSWEELSYATECHGCLVPALILQQAHNLVR